MRAYLKIKKIEIDEHTVVDSQLPEKNKDYTLFIDVALKSKEMTQVETDDDDEEVYYYFETTGSPRLIPRDWRADELPHQSSSGPLDVP